MTPASPSCRKVRDRLPLHVGGDLARDESRAVDEHLHHCLPCFREFRELAAMRARLGVLADAPLPEGILDGFTDEVMARVALDEPGPAAPVLVRRRWAVPRWAPPAAAAVLVMAVGLGTWAAGGAPDAPAGEGRATRDGGGVPPGTMAAADAPAPAPATAPDGADAAPDRPAWPGEVLGGMQVYPASGGVARPVSTGTPDPLARPRIEMRDVELLRAHLRSIGAPLDPLPALEPEPTRRPRERP